MCWGEYDWGGPAPVQGPFEQILASGWSHCGMCGVRPTGELLCWKPYTADYGAEEEIWCGWGQEALVSRAPGLFKPTGFSGIPGATVITSERERALWEVPEGLVLASTQKWDPGGWTETYPGGFNICGICHTGKLLCYDSQDPDKKLKTLFPGEYRDLSGAKNGGCAIREEDSRVVCWGNNPYFDPAKHPFDPPPD